MTQHDKMPRTEVRVFVCVCASTNVSGIYITTFCGKVECYDVAPDTFPQEVCDTKRVFVCVCVLAPTFLVFILQLFVEKLNATM